MANYPDVYSLYRNLLGRDPHPEAIDEATRSTLTEIEAAVLNSPEYLQRQTPVAAAGQGATNVSGAAQVVPGNVTAPNQMNIVDTAGQIALNPSTIVSGQNSLATQVPTIDPNAAGTNINGNSPTYQPATGPNGQTTQAVAAPDVQAVNQGLTATYEAQQTQNAVANAGMTGATGTVSNGALVDANGLVIDTNAIANGQGPLGQALNSTAQQNLEVVDVSTPAGKARADELGPGNYVDSQATIKGQLAQLDADFIGPDGQPKIPTWAQGAARGVSKIAAFSGMTGSAAVAAMATAIQEASLPIAQQEAQFFQTLTIKNLDNRQQSTILKANILANLEMSNQDARTTAAVNNANAFLQMDLANLSNEQQARVINTQARVQSILEDAKAVNTQRMFTAESQNDMDKFYDQLNSQIDMFNKTQADSMSQFNASESNSMSKFNAELENQRQEFYKNMQFNIDTANAKWRQTVTLTDAQMKFDAAATDVKNRIGVSVEMLNQLWDRSDAMLDYVWKSSENEADRKSALAIASMQAQNQASINEANNKSAEKQATTAGVGSVVGTVVGSIASSSAFQEKLTNWLF